MNKFYSLIIALFFATGIYAQTDLETALNFDVTTTDGKLVELFSLLDQGYIVVLDFFHVNCNGCQTYSPEMQLAYQDFGCNSSNVYFLGINKWDDLEDVIEFDETYGVTFPTASGDGYGRGYSAFLKYGIAGTPTLVVIQPDRTITEQVIWPPTREEIVEKVEAAGGVQNACNLGVDDIFANNTQNLKVAPNPAINKTSIFFEEEVPQNSAIEIHDLLGKQIRSYEYINDDIYSNELEINLDGMEAGIYFLTLRNKNTILASSKLIIQ